MLEDDEGEAAASRRSRSLNRRSSAACKQRRTATRFSLIEAADQPIVEDQLADDQRRQTRSKPQRDGRRSSMLIKDFTGGENAEVLNKAERSVGNGVVANSAVCRKSQSGDMDFAMDERHLTRSKTRRSSIINNGNNNATTNDRRRTFVKRQSEQHAPLIPPPAPPLPPPHASASSAEANAFQKLDFDPLDEGIDAVQELSSDDLMKPDSPHEIRELEITEAALTRSPSDSAPNLRPTTRNENQQCSINHQANSIDSINAELRLDSLANFSNDHTMSSSQVNGNRRGTFVVQKSKRTPSPQRDRKISDACDSPSPVIAPKRQRRNASKIGSTSTEEELDDNHEPMDISACNSMISSAPPSRECSLDSISSGAGRRMRSAAQAKSYKEPSLNT